MRYYLDFDRTVFDTDAFTSYLRGKLVGSQVAELPSAEFATALVGMAREGTLSFEPGELSRFLFPDAAQFLRDKENAATVITFGNPVFQEMKVKSALHGIPRMAVMYTGDIRKGLHLAPHTHLHQGAVLVDDSPAELEILAKECPPLTLYEIRRNGGEGDGRWPVIRSLAELPNA